MTIIEILLALSAVYCAGMWLYLAVQSLKTRINYETETFHLGLCCVISAGFLGLLLK